MIMSTYTLGACTLFTRFACAASGLAQTPVTDRQNTKSLEAAVAFAQSLAQWEFIMIGGSLPLLVGTSHYRPEKLWVRLFYLLFLPAWLCLGVSIYGGIRAQEAYLAYLLLPTTTIDGATRALNEHIGKQISWLWVGLGCFGVWLLVYLFWWVSTKKLGQERSPS